MSAGKGDSPRPVNGDRYRANYDLIFSPKTPKKSLPPHANICQHMPTDPGRHTAAPRGAQ
jgi:hypothetical protein